MKRASVFAGARGCMIIAEISANHNGSFAAARALIRKAKECGADAVKFQTYTADTMTIDSSKPCFMIRHPRWGGQTLHQLYTKAQTPWRWFRKLKTIADDAGLLFFSTTFDTASVDLLEELGVPCQKIASFELVDLPLIAYAAKTRKPLILSTGMASAAEIREAVRTAKKAGAADVVLLKCVSSYPADPAQMNLRTMPDMRRRFGCPAGLSDHSLNPAVPVAAAVLGAVVIEKHFTLSRTRRTPDSFFSLEPAELRALVGNVRAAEAALGRVHYGVSGDEKRNKVFRRSLFAVEDIRKGGVFTPQNIRSIRPGNGLSPKYLPLLLGRKARVAMTRGTPVTWKAVAK